MGGSAEHTQEHTPVERLEPVKNQAAQEFKQPQDRAGPTVKQMRYCAVLAVPGEAVEEQTLSLPPARSKERSL